MRAAWIVFLSVLEGMSAAHAESPATRLFADHCVRCHGPDKQKGDLRLDLSLDELVANRELLETILLVLEDGEMPPSDEPRPETVSVSEALRSIKAWLSAEHPVSTLKRLTRVEYTHAINDLFQADLDLTELLPSDHVESGFDKFGEAHLMSPDQVRAYLTTARYAAERLLPSEKPKERSWTFGPENFHGSTRGDYGTNEAFFLSTNYPWRSNLHLSTDPKVYDRFIIPEFGRYRFEVKVEAIQTNKDQIVGVNLGDPRYPTNFRKLKRVFLPKNSSELTVDLTLNEGDEVAFTFDSAKIWTLNKEKAQDYKGPQLRFTGVKIRGPIHDEWPAHAAKTILPNPEIAPEALVDNLVKILTHRPLPPEVRADYIRLAQAKANSGEPSYEVARATLTALLASPQFIYKAESPELTNIELAYRLSYFLWNSVPDRALIDAAQSASFREKLNDQVDRMLDDVKSERFIQDFTRQWLQLDKVDHISPDERVFPDVTPLHVMAMGQEGGAFFQHILANDLSMVFFIDSDFVMVNDQLADFYELPGVKGPEFRPVKLPPDSERGGLIGQAGFLKLTSHTFASSPILRGVWILKNLYGEKMEPPSDLEIEEPDIRGTNTIKEVLAKHQQSESCNRCHSKIDPLGFALEYYDPVGKRRNEYRNVEVVSKEKVHIEKHPIDAEMAMTDGRVLNDMRSLKSAILEDREIVIKCIIGKLISYGVGRETTVLDRPSIDEIYTQIEPRNHSLRAAIQAIVTHPTFARK